MSKTAVVLFNLGGPDSLTAVRPFLFNLFYDKAILSLPNPLRFFLARLISGKREKIASEIYKEIGGKSPILEQTLLQKEALKKQLGPDYEVFIAMRYWHPRSEEVVCEVKAYQPKKIILLPLYPQYSKVTTGSSFFEWYQKAQKYNLNEQTIEVCCYPTDEKFIAAHAALIKEKLKPIKASKKPYRILFSAHGLPEKNIKAGDPYQRQVELTSAAVVEKLAIKNLDWTVCYQSRVGPLQWIGPSTEEEITRAGQDQKHVVVVPIAFVSEHSETLVELDIEYKEFAKQQNCPGYTRVPTVTDHPQFIKSLAELVKKAPNTKKKPCFPGCCDK